MRELHHNTPEQVTSYLRAALNCVDEAEIPEDLRGPAFVKAVDLIAAKQVMLDQADVQPVGVPAMAIPRGRVH